MDLRELPGSEGLNGFADFTIALTASVKGEWISEIEFKTIFKK